MGNAQCVRANSNSCMLQGKHVETAKQLPGAHLGVLHGQDGELRLMLPQRVLILPVSICAAQGMTHA